MICWWPVFRQLRVRGLILGDMILLLRMSSTLQVLSSASSARQVMSALKYSINLSSCWGFNSLICLETKNTTLTSIQAEGWWESAWEQPQALLLQKRWGRQVNIDHSGPTSASQGGGAGTNFMRDSTCQTCYQVRSNSSGENSHENLVPDQEKP